MNKPDSSWFVFLAIAFAVVGLTGMFGTFAAPVALQRAVLRDEVLEEARAALAKPDAAARIEAMRARLDDSAEALLPFGGDMEARIAAERTAMHARLRLDGDATTRRLRWLIGAVTIMAGIFGMMVLGAAGGQKRRNPADATSNTRDK